MPPRRIPGLKPVQFELEPGDLAALDEAAAELARRTRSIPSRVRALRWAIRELSGRLALASKARGAGPVFTAPGPMTPPPD